MTLSIIIPVYRTEATLDRCVESIVEQTYTDMEVIMVDDGSPDRCGQMCDAWARRDSRIRVVHQENGGLSAARNTGIERAKGAFVTFVDSDDYLQADTYAKVMAIAPTADIVEFPVCRQTGADSYATRGFDDHAYTDMKDYWLTARAYEHAYACNKIYRRALFDTVRFPEGKVFEDVLTLPRLLEKASTVKTCNEGCYHYTLNGNGITQTATGQQLATLLEGHLKVMNHWHNERYYLHVLNIQMDVCERTGREPALPYRHINPLTRGLSTTERLKALTQNIFGIKGICNINRFIHQHLLLRRS